MKASEVCNNLIKKGRSDWKNNKTPKALIWDDCFRKRDNPLQKWPLKYSLSVTGSDFCDNFCRGYFSGHPAYTYTRYAVWLHTAQMSFMCIPVKKKVFLPLISRGHTQFIGNSFFVHPWCNSPIAMHENFVIRDPTSGVVKTGFTKLITILLTTMLEDEC